MTMMCALLTTGEDCPEDFPDDVNPDGSYGPIPCETCKHYRDVKRWEFRPGWTPVWERGIREIMRFHEENGQTLHAHMVDYGRCDG